MMTLKFNLKYLNKLLVLTIQIKKVDCSRCYNFSGAAGGGEERFNCNQQDFLSRFVFHDCLRLKISGYF